MASEISDFKGHPLLVLKEFETDERGFSFGLKKAKLIISNLDAVKDFIKESEEKIERDKSWEGFEG